MRDFSGSRDFSDDSRHFLRSGGSFDCFGTCGRDSSYRKAYVRYELGRAPREVSLDSGVVEAFFLQRLSRALDFLPDSVSSSEKFLPDVHDSSDEFGNGACDDSSASDDGFRGFAHRFEESWRAQSIRRLFLCLLGGCGRRLRFRYRSVESFDGVTLRNKPLHDCYGVGSGIQGYDVVDVALGKAFARFRGRDFLWSNLRLLRCLLLWLLSVLCLLRLLDFRGGLENLSRSHRHRFRRILRERGHSVEPERRHVRGHPRSFGDVLRIVPRILRYCDRIFRRHRDRERVGRRSATSAGVPSVRERRLPDGRKRSCVRYGSVPRVEGCHGYSNGLMNPDVPADFFGVPERNAEMSPSDTVPSGFPRSIDLLSHRNDLCASYSDTFCEWCVLIFERRDSIGSFVSNSTKSRSALSSESVTAEPASSCLTSATLQVRSVFSAW